MTEPSGFQFDRAEYDTGPSQAACAECQQPLAGFYYDVNGQMVCERCRHTIESAFTSGSAGGRLLRATGAGLVAAALGSALYYAISALSGYEFGLIAIVVGWAVGSAVRWGSNGRGGWVYQTLAIALTYLAIVSTYIPPIIGELSKLQPTEAAVASDQQTPGTTPAESASATASDGSQPVDQSQPAPFVIVAAFILAIAIVAPFLAGFENIIGIVIIGIGLYEAWKLNRRTELIISGPHVLASGAAATVSG